MTKREVRAQVVELLAQLWAGHPLDAILTGERLAQGLAIDAVDIRREADQIRRADARAMAEDTLAAVRAG